MPTFFAYFYAESIHNLTRQKYAPARRQRRYTFKARFDSRRKMAACSFTSGDSFSVVSAACLGIRCPGKLVFSIRWSVALF